MSAEKIEGLLGGAGVNFEKVNERTWEITPGKARAIEGKLVWISNTYRKTGDLLKIHARVGKLPADADVKLFQDIFRKNRDMGHGAFALAGEDNCCFVDTLELAGCDQNEMNSTLDWIAAAGNIFREKLDRSKLPYLEN